MTLSELSVSILMGLSGLLGIKEVPENRYGWNTSGWFSKGGSYHLTASHNGIGKACENGGVVVLPRIIHSHQTIRVDGIPVLTFGSPDFDQFRSFYGTPVVECKKLQNAKTIEWEVASYSKYFSRFNHFPEVREKAPWGRLFFEEPLSLVSSGILGVLSILSIFMFFGRIPFRIISFFSSSCLLYSIYFLCTSAGLISNSMGMLTAHKIADFSVILATGLIFFIYYDEKLISPKFLRLFLINAAVSFLVLIAASSGDAVQLGTSIVFPVTLTIIGIAVSRLILGAKDIAKEPRQLFKALSLTSFLLAGVHDIFLVIGVIDSTPLLALGCIGLTLFFALSVNESIKNAYNERDFLRKNLEEEVKRKTHSLTVALAELQTAQAELVHSAKLASLGTLAAGIAHEINNSLNYVNGALPPFKRILSETELSPEKKAKSEKLLAVMQDGLKLTFDIIRSLRNYTGLNQSKHGDVNLFEVVQDVLVILKTKIGTATVDNLIDPSLFISGDRVGLNQVFMNLISNAIDATRNRENPRIIVDARIRGTELAVTISDNGGGIPSEILPRIFDPFFTTKKVGEGTGLGLHLVQKEILRHDGKIEVRNTEAGAEFEIKFTSFRNGPGLGRNAA